jgi:hypothetical protein
MIATAGKLWARFPKALAVILLLFVVTGAVCSQYIAANRLGYPPIRSDGFGYYAYLTSVFVDHNLNFRTALANMPPTEVMASYGFSIYPGTGYIVDKYTAGVALLQLPFFLVAHVAAHLLGYDMHGYSTPYQVGVLVASTTYAVIGLIFTYKLLTSYFAKLPTLLTIACLLLGTNLFHYATYDASFSHVYSFCLVAVFAYLVLGRRELTKTTSLLAGLALGLIVLTRVPNAILLLLFVWKVATTLWRGRRPSVRSVIINSVIFALSALVAFSPQMAYWYRTTGHVFVYSYQGESFDFLHPQLLNYLFSVSKGLFFWSPVLLLTVVGLVMSARRVHQRAGARPLDFVLPVSLVIAVHVYVCSSWWAWDYGGSYACRPVVDVLSLYMLPTAAFFSVLVKKKAVVWVAVGLVLVGLFAVNAGLMYSYWRSFIPFRGTTLGILHKVPRKLLAALAGH